jgi:hypothetical protein
VRGWDRGVSEICSVEILGFLFSLCDASAFVVVSFRRTALYFLLVAGFPPKEHTEVYIKLEHVGLVSILVFWAQRRVNLKVDTQV